MSENDDPQQDEVPWTEAHFLATDDDNKNEWGLTRLFLEPDHDQTFEFKFEPNITIKLAGHKEENGQILNSTGLTLWSASTQLCGYLIANPDLVRGKRVLELGAGLGLCGILAWKLKPRRIILTDGDTETLANMRFNVNRNCSSAGGDCPTIDCQQLIWGCDGGPFIQCNQHCFDTLLGSDITYTETALEPLFQTVDQMLSSNNSQGRFLLAFVRRNVAIESVLDVASRKGFVWVAPDTVDGVYVFSRKSSTGTIG